MIYSVWNQAAGQYDYWRNGTAQATVNVEKPAHIVSRTLGSTIDQAAWPLPPDAVLVGHGAHPVGRIASRTSQAAALDGIAELATWRTGLLAAGAYLLWRYARGARK